MKKEMNEEKISKLIDRAVNHRRNVGWDEQAEIALKVKRNHLRLA